MKCRSVQLVFAAVCIAGMVRTARAEPSREYAVKAAFIYNFAQFTQWPADAFTSDDSPFVIGIVGDDPFDHALDQAVAGKSWNHHAMTVRHLRTEDDFAG